MDEQKIRFAKAVVACHLQFVGAGFDDSPFYQCYFCESETKYHKGNCIVLEAERFLKENENASTIKR
jgi:hypothetical protein